MAKGPNTVSKTAVWILLGLLIIGLAGFGATSFSGTVRSVGSVGDAEISTSDYARLLRNELNAQTAQTGSPMSIQQAQAQGLTQRVLSRLVVSAALEHEADRIGLSVGDERLAEELRAIAAFQGPDGQFDREAYAFALRNAGLSEAEFEADLRDDSAATLLQGAVLAGTTMPDAYLDTLIGYTAETRDFTWARLGPGALDAGVPEPSEDALRAHYEDNIDRYTRPRTKRITYAWLTPDMILDSVEIDETALRAAYDEQQDRFNQPERRLVERLVMPSQEAAEDAAQRIAGGEATFEDIVAGRDLALADTDMGDVTRGDLGAAADTVFGAETGETVVAPSPLGPALYRVNGVLAAQETSFEDAVPALRDTLALDRARRVIEAQAQGYDDELAAGATLEQLAETTDLRLGEIGWTGQNTGGIAGYEAFAEAAEAVTQDDFPQIEGLGDGGLFALRLDAVEEPAPIPFDEIRASVERDWEAAQRRDALVEQAEGLRDRLAEGATFEAVGLDPRSETGLTRNAFAIDLPQGLLAEAFTMEPGGVSVLPGRDGALIVRLDAIGQPDLDDPDIAQLRDFFGDDAANGVAEDLFRALASDIQARAGVEIDQAAINAVHATLQ